MFLRKRKLEEIKNSLFLLLCIISYDKLLIIFKILSSILLYIISIIKINKTDYL